MTRARDKPLRHLHSCRKHHDEGVPSSKKKKKEFKTRVKKMVTLFITKMAKNGYLWPKRLENHTLWHRTYLFSPYKGVTPELTGNTYKFLSEANVDTSCHRSHMFK